MQLSLRITVVYSSEHETQNLAFGGQKTGPGRAQNRVQKTNSKAGIFIFGELTTSKHFTQFKFKQRQFTRVKKL